MKYIWLLVLFAMTGCMSTKRNKEMKIEKEIHFSVSQERVWEVLTNPEQTRKYMFGCELISEWKVGAPMLWKGKTNTGEVIVYVKGNILELEQGKKVTFSMFDPNMNLEDIPANYLIMTYEVIAKGKGTILRLRQENFRNNETGKKRYEESLKGWEAIIPDLKQIAEQE